MSETNQSNMRVYVRNNRKVPVGIVTYTIDSDGTVKYGTATHCPTDRYDRNEGGRISAIRLNRKPDTFTLLSEDRTPFGAIVQILLHVRKNERLPKLIRYNTKRTLKLIRRKLEASIETGSGNLGKMRADLTYLAGVLDATKKKQRDLGNAHSAVMNAHVA